MIYSTRKKNMKIQKTYCPLLALRYFMAPFSTWLLANALYFIIPAIAMFIIGMIIKKKM